MRSQPARTCHSSSDQIVCSDGRQWPHSARSSSPTRGFSGTSIGASTDRVTSSKHDRSSSTSGRVDSRSPIGSVRWYAESAGAVS